MSDIDIGDLGPDTDERLWIRCGCGHNAAFHDDKGCHRVSPAKTVKSGSSSYGSTETIPESACTCPAPREVVYISGRTPDAAVTA